VAEIVGGQEVEAPVAHPGWSAGESIQRTLDGRTHLLCRFGSRRSARCVGCPRQVEEVCRLGHVELQRADQGVKDSLGDASQVSAFEARVVVHADAGEGCDLRATQTFHPAVPAVGGKPCFLRGEPRPARHQEIPHVVDPFHPFHGTSFDRRMGGSVITSQGRGTSRSTARSLWKSRSMD
jgi:hypothetical protein